jgi:hypothetical protein
LAAMNCLQDIPRSAEQRQRIDYGLYVLRLALCLRALRQ